jgi:hypothetical protein
MVDVLLISWPYSGFNVHSLVRTKTKLEAERVGRYMIRMVRYYGPYANAHRGQVKKASLSASLRTGEEKFRLLLPRAGQP